MGKQPRSDESGARRTREPPLHARLLLVAGMLMRVLAAVPQGAGCELASLLPHQHGPPVPSCHASDGEACPEEEHCCDYGCDHEGKTCHGQPVAEKLDGKKPNASKTFNWVAVRSFVVVDDDASLRMRSSNMATHLLRGRT